MNEEYIALMMKCIDGEASPEEQAALHTHLEQCEKCRVLYESYLEVDKAVQSTQEEPPDTLTDAVMNSIRREKSQNQPKNLFRRYRFTMIAVAAAVVVLVAAKMGGNLSFQNSAKAESSAAESAAEMIAADTAEMTAEFRSGGTADTAAEAKAEAVPQMEDAAPAEEPAAAAEEAAAPNGETVFDNGVKSTAVRECTAAMKEAGYAGTVFFLSDTKVEDLEKVFPDLVERPLKNEIVIYEIQESEVQTVWDQFPVIDNDTVELEGQEPRYFISLQA